jgi:hypothetical protein
MRQQSTERHIYAHVFFHCLSSCLLVYSLILSSNKRIYSLETFAEGIIPFLMVFVPYIWITNVFTSFIFNWKSPFTLSMILLPIARTMFFSLFGTLLFALLVFLFSAPLDLKTICWCLLANFAVLVQPGNLIQYQFGELLRRTQWSERPFFLYASYDTVQKLEFDICWSQIAVNLFCIWISAAVIPLDWDRPWQVMFYCFNCFVTCFFTYLLLSRDFPSVVHLE